MSRTTAARSRAAVARHHIIECAGNAAAAAKFPPSPYGTDGSDRGERRISRSAPRPSTKACRPAKGLPNFEELVFASASSLVQADFGHTPETEHPVQVSVRDNNVDQALRALKKKMQREGIFREMKMRNFFEKPSEKRVREKAEAVRRARKLARKQAQREGLVSGGRSH